MCNPRVLVVEDDDAIRDSVAEILADEGYDVSLAADGGAGLRAARARRPDVVVLDLKMPNVSGPDYIIASRADPALAEVPVIVMTADATAERSAGLAVAAICVKPFRADRLLREIKHVLPRRETCS